MAGKNNPVFLCVPLKVYRHPASHSLGLGEGKITHVPCTSKKWCEEPQRRLDFTIVSLSQHQSPCLFPGFLLFKKEPIFLADKPWYTP